MEASDDMLLVRIQASHFLWRMVRRVTGALVKVGLGELSVAAFGELVDARCNSRYPIAEWTAPASGLFLEKIIYGEQAKRPKPNKGRTRERS